MVVRREERWSEWNEWEQVNQRDGIHKYMCVFWRLWANEIGSQWFRCKLASRITIHCWPNVDCSNESDSQPKSIGCEFASKVTLLWIVCDVVWKPGLDIFNRLIFHILFGMVTCNSVYFFFGILHALCEFVHANDKLSQQLPDEEKNSTQMNWWLVSDFVPM